MSIHEHLPPAGEEGPEGSGLDEGVRAGEGGAGGGFAVDCATWLHKARSMPKEQFKREVE